MGLLNPVAEFIVKAHSLNPLWGGGGSRVLFIGRQTVPLGEKKLELLLSKYNLSNKAKGPVEFDNETRGAESQKYITDRYLMQALGVENFESLDVVDYEQADIIHDLGIPIGEEHYSKYDFIYNGGCFDNMFNPGIALQLTLCFH